MYEENIFKIIIDKIGRKRLEIFYLFKYNYVARGMKLYATTVTPVVILFKEGNNDLCNKA